MAETRAVTQLEREGVPFTAHRYRIPTQIGTNYGEAAAEALGVQAGRVFKTLVAEVDGEPVVGIVPVTGSLSLKALARARGGKRASMADPAAAERLSGYVTGGISPFGQRRRMPAVVDSSVAGWETVFVSGGLRGLQLELSGDDLILSTGAEVAPIAR